MPQSWRIGGNELEYVRRVLTGGFPGAQEENFTRKLESAFAEKFGSQFAITFTNGTATLHAALVACGVGPGDEVIVPPLTMSSTSIAVLHAGARPVYADVDAATFNLSAATVAPRITPRTKAIMPVSLYGLPAALPELMELAARHHLPVIEDSAQCFLGRVHGKAAGTIGAVGSFSFQNSKHMTCGEGGIVVTDNPDHAQRMRRFSSLGYGQISAAPGQSKIDKNAIAAPETIRHVEYGYNYRLSELCSAVACAQLERLDLLVARRRECARHFLDAVSGCEFLTPQQTPDGVEHSYWACALRLDTDRVPWHRFRDVFLKRGGDGFYGAWRLTYQEPYYAKLFPEALGTCPNAEALQPRMIQLKTHYGDTEEMKRQAAILKATIHDVR